MSRGCGLPGAGPQGPGREKESNSLESRPRTTQATERKRRDGEWVAAP